MENVNVYSPVEDKKINSNLNDSPIWKNCFHETELADAQKKFAEMYLYVIKFDGTKPIQVTNMKKVMR